MPEIAIVVFVIFIIFVARAIKIVPQQNAWVVELSLIHI